MWLTETTSKSVNCCKSGKKKTLYVFWHLEENSYVFSFAFSFESACKLIGDVIDDFKTIFNFLDSEWFDIFHNILNTTKVVTPPTRNYMIWYFFAKTSSESNF